MQAIIDIKNANASVIIFLVINLLLNIGHLSCTQNIHESSQPDLTLDNNIQILNTHPRRRHHSTYKNDIDENELLQMNEQRYKNFLLTDYLADGEMERRINYNGITAKETSISTSNKFLSLWQLSNGHQFIQMIYSSIDFDLIDCEYVGNHEFVDSFLKKFYNEIETADRLRNFSSLITPSYKLYRSQNDLTGLFESDNGFGMRNLSYAHLQTDEDVPNELVPLLNYDHLKEQCDSKHQQMLRVIKDLKSSRKTDQDNASEHLSRRKRAISDFFIAPNTKWCGSGQTANTYTQLGGASKADKCCRRHDHCKFNIHAMTTKWHYFNFRPFTISHCSCDMRQRRDLSNLLRVPGTKWCGKGYTAKKYTEMGGYSKADRCCRQHDKSCPFWIMGFETKYGFFNWRVNTLMHCKCDERFRTCLKAARSDDANFVGRLFFNIVQTKCFVLKPEKVCKQYSWWGNKCLRRGIRKRAHLRDNRKF